MYPWVGSPQRATGVWGPSSSVWYGFVVTQDGPRFSEPAVGSFSHIDTGTIYALDVAMYFLAACRGDERRRPFGFLYNPVMLWPIGWLPILWPCQFIKGDYLWPCQFIKGDYLQSGTWSNQFIMWPHLLAMPSYQGWLPTIWDMT
jgi:hypothetical protein